MLNTLCSIVNAYVINIIGYDIMDIDGSILDIALIARQILQLTISTTPPTPPEPTGPSGLVIGLIVAAVVLTFMLVVVIAFIIWSRLCRTKRYMH